METIQANLLLEISATLGEGPLWMAETQQLMWVDIIKGEVHAFDWLTQKDSIIYQGQQTSCIVPLSQKEFLIADTNSIIQFNIETGKAEPYLTIPFAQANSRFNDGKVDPNGAFWIGSMEQNAKPNMGSLFSVSKEKKIKEWIKGTTISNGLAWSLDKQTMYFIDTAEQAIFAFDFNDNSELSNKRIAFRIPKELGAPDGMTIDRNGYLWIAMWGGFAVICFEPKTGDIIQKVRVPCPQVTSCTFGGPNMDILMITSARAGLNDTDLEAYPLSGSLFQIKLDLCV